MAIKKYEQSELQLIRNIHAKNCSEDEFKLLVYMAGKYDLDILSKEIWCIKYGSSPATIFTGRDGFLSIAHKSGQLDGMKAGTFERDKVIFGYCEIFRKDMTKPFYVEVSINEYHAKNKMWNTKPLTMIQKVAESQCLRRAFNINGLYSPEEFDQVEKVDISKTKPKKVEIEVLEKPAKLTKLQKTKKDLWEKSKEKGLELPQLEEMAMNLFSVQDLKKLKQKQADELLKLVDETL